MRILLVSTLKRKVDKTITASRSRIIFELGRELTKRGHSVTLLGTKDSNIPGVQILSVIDKAFNELPPFENDFYAETSYLISLEKKIEELAGNYDLIHNNTYPEFINLYAAEIIKTPMVTTLHAQVTQEYDNVLSLFPKANLVSISKSHKNLFKKTNPGWIVYNGIDTDQYSYEEHKDNYLLWLGRLGRAKDKTGNYFDAKGIRWAIKLAQDMGLSLKASGNIEDMNFYEKDVKPHLNDKIQWTGKLSTELPLTKKEVSRLMQKAKAFLMTINWEEPFGLVMAEAMSCGTPVIAYNRGAVSEIVKDGVTGFIVDPDDSNRPGKGTWVVKEKGLDGLKEAVKRINEIDAKKCREHVVANFSLTKMAEGYENVYKKILENGLS